MPKEILLYNPIYSSTAADFINEMEANQGTAIVVRVNCPGGDVFAAMGLLAKFNEHKGGKTVKVDGRAASAAALFCCVADNVECISSSEFLFHRAAFPSWVEDDPKLFTDELKAMLTRHNGILRSAIESKLDIAKFTEISGKTLDEMFSLDSRIDIMFTAVQAKAIGLVNKVVQLTASKKIEINAYAASLGMAAVYNDKNEAEAPKPTTMTAAEFKAAHPAEFKAIQTEATTEERDRVGSWLAWQDTDPEAVAKGIEDGTEVTRKVNAEMTVKAVAKAGLKQAEAENIPDLSTGTAATVATAAEIADLEYAKQLEKAMGLKATK